MDHLPNQRDDSNEDSTFTKAAETAGGAIGTAAAGLDMLGRTPTNAVSTAGSTMRSLTSETPGPAEAPAPVVTRVRRARKTVKRAKPAAAPKGRRVKPAKRRAKAPRKAKKAARKAAPVARTRGMVAGRKARKSAKATRKSAVKRSMRASARKRR